MKMTVAVAVLTTAAVLTGTIATAMEPLPWTLPEPKFEKPEVSPEEAGYQETEDIIKQWNDNSKQVSTLLDKYCGPAAGGEFDRMASRSLSAELGKMYPGTSMSCIDRTGKFVDWYGTVTTLYYGIDKKVEKITPYGVISRERSDGTSTFTLITTDKKASLRFKYEIQILSGSSRSKNFEIERITFPDKAKFLVRGIAISQETLAKKFKPFYEKYYSQKKVDIFTATWDLLTNSESRSKFFAYIGDAQKE